MARLLKALSAVWRSRGTIDLDPPRPSSEVTTKLSGLFQPGEAEVDVAEGTIAYRKSNPAAQDPLATFSNGQFQVADGRLHYDAGSPALLLVFLAPLLFLALGEAKVGLAMWEDWKAASAPAPKKDAKADAKKVDAKKGDPKKDKVRELHWIDKALGAPAPPKPKTDQEKERDKKKSMVENDDYSPLRAYGIAAAFAVLYAVGRCFEPRRLRAILRQCIDGESAKEQGATVRLAQGT